MGLLILVYKKKNFEQNFVDFVNFVIKYWVHLPVVLVLGGTWAMRYSCPVPNKREIRDISFLSNDSILMRVLAIEYILIFFYN